MLRDKRIERGDYFAHKCIAREAGRIPCVDAKKAAGKEQRRSYPWALLTPAPPGFRARKRGRGMGGGGGTIGRQSNRAALHGSSSAP